LPDKPRPWFLIVSASALAVLLLTLVPVWIFNQPLFELLNGSHTRFTDPIWLALTTLGDGVILAIILGAFLLVNPRITVMGLVLMLFASVVANTIKLLVPTIRPAALLDTVHVLGPLLRSGAFPSGHTAAGMAAALSIAYFSTSRARCTIRVEHGCLDFPVENLRWCPLSPRCGWRNDLCGSSLRTFHTLCMALC
jgi:membrane-associated phospholipid phosphatase